jgi:hypothetical protein
VARGSQGVCEVMLVMNIAIGNCTLILQQINVIVKEVSILWGTQVVPFKPLAQLQKNPSDTVVQLPS